MLCPSISNICKKKKKALEQAVAADTTANSYFEKLVGYFECVDILNLFRGNVAFCKNYFVEYDCDVVLNSLYFC